MNVAEVLTNYGFTRIESGRIMKIGDEAVCKKAIRNAKHRISRGGVYAITGENSEGEVIPFYVGSSKNVKDRLCNSSVVYAALVHEYTNIKVYFKLTHEYLFTESFIIEEMRPVHNSNRPWRPREFTITI
jgi:hypothetical protein